MKLSYDKLSQQPQVFLKLTGVSVDTFDELIKRLKPSFEQLAAQKILPGHTSRLATEADKLLCYAYIPGIYI